jgi:hypothetical protein
VEKYSKKTGLSVACQNKECGYKEEPKPEGQESGSSQEPAEQGAAE